MANGGNLNYGIADAGSITLTANDTSAIALYSPYANSMNVAFTSSQLYAMAQGARAIRWDYDKQGTLAAQFEVFDLKWLPIVLGGSDWGEGVADLFEVKHFTIAETVDLGETPLADSLSIFKTEADKIGHKSEITEGTPASNPDEYSITGSTVTFNTGDVGETAVAYFLKASAATALSYSVPVDVFPKSYTINCISTIKAKYNGVEEEIQLTAKNATPMTDFTLNFSETEVTTLDATFDLLPDEDGNMLTFVRP